MPSFSCNSCYGAFMMQKQKKRKSKATQHKTLSNSNGKPNSPDNKRRETHQEYRNFSINLEEKGNKQNNFYVLRSIHDAETKKKEKVKRLNTKQYLTLTENQIPRIIREEKHIKNIGT